LSHHGFSDNFGARWASEDVRIGGNVFLGLFFDPDAHVGFELDVQVDGDGRARRLRA
jgi:hypothetical protein